MRLSFLDAPRVASHALTLNHSLVPSFRMPFAFRKKNKLAWAGILRRRDGRRRDIKGSATNFSYGLDFSIFNVYSYSDYAVAYYHLLSFHRAR